MADQIAILAAPGRLLAEGSPVALKSTLGEGYTIHVTFREGMTATEKSNSPAPAELVDDIRALAPSTYVSSPSDTQISYHLRSKDSVTVEGVLHLLEGKRDEFGIASFDVQGTTIEDIFLGLMTDEPVSMVEKADDSVTVDSPGIDQLTNGRKTSPLRQALTIYNKRVCIAKRSWLTPLILVLIAVLASCIPLFFMRDRPQSCTTVFHTTPKLPLYLPDSSFALSTITPDNGANIFVAPPNLLASLGPSISTIVGENVADNAAFVNTISREFQGVFTGGISIDSQTAQALIAWESSPPGSIGPVLLNLVDNILYNRALNTSDGGNSSASIIQASYQSFPAVETGTLVALKWIAFFGAAMVRLHATSPGREFP